MMIRMQLKQLGGVLLALLLFLPASYAQQGTVSGRVVDQQGQPLEGVTVTVQSQSRQTVTDNTGNYRIAATSAHTLVFSLVGMAPQEVVVGNRSAINVTLTPSSETLDEVAVTAFGIKREERSLGYTAQSVTAEELSFNQQPNLVNALQGKAAGIQIRNTGGAPGKGAKIQIGGIHSLDPTLESSPLFVIAGVIMDNSPANRGEAASIRGMSNRAVDINPDDIASMNILRGGAATALYGLRGSNGVVVITTKQGQAGDIRISYQGSVGVDEVHKLP